MLHSMAESYGQRPSAILGLSDPVAAFQFDEALFLRARVEEGRREKQRVRDHAAGRDRDERGEPMVEPVTREDLSRIPWAAGHG